MPLKSESPQQHPRFDSDRRQPLNTAAHQRSPSTSTILSDEFPRLPDNVVAGSGSAERLADRPSSPGPFHDIPVNMMVSMSLSDRRSMTPADPYRQSGSGLKHRAAQEVVIAVMGKTGSGKSTFISKLAARDYTHSVGHGLTSQTRELAEVDCKLDGLNIVLVDTPGFDDTTLGDGTILKRIADWLATTYDENKRLSGVIYMHDINEARVGGSSVKNMMLFRKITGEDSMKNVILLTTKWDMLQDEQTGERREKELCRDPGFWKQMLADEASTKRHCGSKESAIEAIRGLIMKQPIFLKLQQQMAAGVAIGNTDAGQVVNQELHKLQETYRQEMREYHAEMERARKRNNVELLQAHEASYKNLVMKFEASREQQALLMAEQNSTNSALLAELRELKNRVGPEYWSGAQYPDQMRSAEAQMATQVTSPAFSPFSPQPDTVSSSTYGDYEPPKQEPLSPQQDTVSSSTYDYGASYGASYGESYGPPYGLEQEPFSPQQGTVSLSTYGGYEPPKQENQNSLPDELDIRFKVEPSWRFEVGKIFKILWSEPIGAQATSEDHRIQRNQWGDQFYICFRRFIVAKTDEGHALCVPILTYEGRACTKRGVKADKHGIIHAYGSRPQRVKGEPDLGFSPIRMEIEAEGEKLAHTSRVNYNKFQTIEHNMKVFFIGKVRHSDLEIFREAIDSCWREKKSR